MNASLYSLKSLLFIEQQLAHRMALFSSLIGLIGQLIIHVHGLYTLTVNSVSINTSRCVLVVQLIAQKITSF